MIYNLVTLQNLEYLVLNNNNFSGEIPDYIYQLDLESLSLSGNNFSGEISPDIGNLSDIRYLSLARNNFSGEIPIELYSLDNLWRIQLDNNNFSGLIDSSICLLDLHVWFSEWGTNYNDSRIDNNQFCPPYPDCVEHLIGNQNTANCP